MNLSIKAYSRPPIEYQSTLERMLIELNSHVNNIQRLNEQPNISRLYENELLIAFDGDTMVAFLSYETSESKITIHHLYVTPTYRRRGIGGSLIEAVLSRQNIESFELFCPNDPAIVSFYKKYGFCVVSNTAIFDVRRNAVSGKVATFKNNIILVDGLVVANIDCSMGTVSKDWLLIDKFTCRPQFFDTEKLNIITCLKKEFPETNIICLQVPANNTYTEIVDILNFHVIGHVMFMEGQL